MDIKEEPQSDPPYTEDSEIGHLTNEDLNGQLLADENRIHEPLVGIEEEKGMTGRQGKHQKTGQKAILAPTNKILQNLTSLKSKDLDIGIHEPLLGIDEKNIEMIEQRRQEKEQRMNQKAILAPTNKILQNLNNLNNAKMTIDDNIAAPKVKLEEPTTAP